VAGDFADCRCGGDADGPAARPINGRRLWRAHTSPDPQCPTTALVTDGLYRPTPNPIYLGFLLIYFGFTFLAGILWGLLLVPFLLGTVSRAVIQAEELYLESRFEDRCTTYEARVRQWL
jgi:protein-S-isoprenylcysteine O-methyltransferase Ste14